MSSRDERAHCRGRRRGGAERPAPGRTRHRRSAPGARSRPRPARRRRRPGPGSRRRARPRARRRSARARERAPATQWARSPASKARRERSDRLRQILPRQHGGDAGRAPRARHVHAAHVSVRVHAPHEGGVEQPGHPEIVEVGAAPGQQARVLDALDAPARQPRGDAQTRAPGRPQGLATRGRTSPARSSSCSMPQLSGFSTICSQPPRAATFARIFSASSSASPRR